MDKKKLAVLFFAGLLSALPVVAQETSEENEIETTINLDTTVQIKAVDDDSSKAEEYGEVPEGFLINHVDIQLEINDDRHLSIYGDRVRRNNAAYGMEYSVEAKYRLSVDYMKIPHLFSRSGETIWTEVEPGIWELPDSVQNAIQNINPVDPTDPSYSTGLAAQRAFISNLLTTAHPVSLDLQRNRGTVEFEGTPGTDWKYDLQYFQENRDGYRPFGTAFGFSWVTELPETIDYQTTNLHGSLQYSTSGRLFAFTYDYSRFANENDVFRWDNPYRITDRTYEFPSGAYVNGDGTSRGQLQLPADNTGNTFGFQAAANFGKSRVSGSLNYSIWTDDVDLLPFTINTAIPEIPLPASSFNGDIKNLNLNLNYNTRFGESGSFNARYRLYDQSNNSDQFFFAEYVRFDQNHELLDKPNPLFEYTYNTLDMDLGWTLRPGLQWRVAYTYTGRDYEFREINSDSTHAFRTSIDWLPSEITTVRVSYQYSRRRFDEFHDENPTYLVIPLRRYDIADVNVNLLRADAEFSLGEKSVIGVNAAFTGNDYSESVFGLTKVDEYSVGADYTYSINENSSLNAWYEYQSLVSDQLGRQSGGSPSTDPAANWSANLDDKYNTIGGGYSTDLMNKKVTWDTYVMYAMADGDANLASPPGGTPDAAQSLENMDETDLLMFKTSANWRCTERVRVVIGYWLERYLIDDYAEDTIQTDLVQFGTILLNATQPDYLYNVGWLGLVYNW